ncbi:MAG: HIT domain-containing protein [candidate division NC10 bacterium]|nr:HIT domain-containing protein [candidate division NC10 bacterium]MBI4390446.1 HIT domain-containing protein [candidate division NC10 bacterium]
METCPFCRIREGVLPAHLLYQDEEILAFLDIAPLTPGHTLVIPRRHAASLTECPPGTVAALFAAAVRLARAIQKALGAPGFNLGLNDGRAAGQEVPHVHVHVVPRYGGEGGGIQRMLKTRGPVPPLAETAAKILAALAS